MQEKVIECRTNALFTLMRREMAGEISGATANVGHPLRRHTFISTILPNQNRDESSLGAPPLLGFRLGSSLVQAWWPLQKFLRHEAD